MSAGSFPSIVSYTGVDSLTRMPACIAAPTSAENRLFAAERVSWGRSRWCPWKYSSSTSLPWRAMRTAWIWLVLTLAMGVSMIRCTNASIIGREMPTSSSVAVGQPSSRSSGLA
jgi:hypothetical protein